MVNFDEYVNSVGDKSRQLYGLDSAMAQKIRDDLDSKSITLEEMQDIVILYQISYGVDLGDC